MYILCRIALDTKTVTSISFFAVWIFNMKPLLFCRVFRFFTAFHSKAHILWQTGNKVLLEKNIGLRLNVNYHSLQLGGYLGSISLYWQCIQIISRNTNNNITIWKKLDYIWYFAWCLISSYLVIAYTVVMNLKNILMTGKYDNIVSNTNSVLLDTWLYIWWYDTQPRWIQNILYNSWLAMTVVLAYMYI